MKLFKPRENKYHPGTYYASAWHSSIFSDDGSKETAQAGSDVANGASMGRRTTDYSRESIGYLL